MIPLPHPHDFYGAQPPSVQAAIDAASTYKDLPKIGRVMPQGEPSHHLHQMISGEVKVSSVSRDGRETVVALIREGGWVSLSEIFFGFPGNADVTAPTPRPANTCMLARTPDWGSTCDGPESAYAMHAAFGVDATRSCGS